MPVILYLDTETYCELNIVSAGLAAYTSHPSFEVLMVSYAIDDADPQLWFPKVSTLPADLHRALADPQTRIVAHNAPFDQRALRMARLFTPRINLDMNRWLCTEAQALSHSLPGSLEELCEVLDVPKELRKHAGKKLINHFTRPWRGAPRPREGALWQEFQTYALYDIIALREVAERLPSWNYPGVDWPDKPGSEYLYWLHQHFVNERGMGVDVQFAEGAVALAEANREELNAEVSRITNGEVGAATQRDVLLRYLHDTFGLDLADLTKDAVAWALKRTDLHPTARHLLELRQQAAQNTAAKYSAMLNAVSADGRFRHGLRYCGAQTTGRDTGRVFQPQNLKRPSLKDDEIADSIEAIREGRRPKGNPADVLGDCVRGVVTAAPKHQLVASDLSAIEARVLAWLAGDQPVVDYFAKFDRGEVKHDIYQSAYGMAFGIDPDTVDSDQRRIGKAMALGLGYGGGVGAFLTFAHTVGIDLSEMTVAVRATADPGEFAAALDKYEWAVENGYSQGLPADKWAACEYLKNRWRMARQPTVRFWSQLEDALGNSVVAPGRVFLAGEKIAIRTKGDWTQVRLPSKRCVTMKNVRMAGSQIVYDGVTDDGFTGSLLPIYGGKLSGWVTQATARDLLKASALRVEAAGFPVVLAVHDELVTEPPARPEFSHERLSQLMTEGETWTQGLPLAAAGWSGKRYRK